VPTSKGKNEGKRGKGRGVEGIFAPHKDFEKPTGLKMYISSPPWK